MTKCPKLFSWVEGRTLPRLNSIFKTMNECTSEKLYIYEREDEEGYIGLIVGANSRQNAIDFVYNGSRIDGKKIYLKEDIQRRVKLWDDDLAKGYESKEGKSPFEIWFDEVDLMK
ncbi:MAG: hypothetical protein KAT05_01745 [Spirochaetes bacterium]|nr:hypothetical protein [Spirochaetota bacterium]